MSNILISKSIFREDRFFEVVSMEDLPEHYFVWNIGRHNFNFPKFVPFAEGTNIPYHVNIDTLKAVELPSEEIAARILKEAGRHEVTKSDVMRIISA